MYANTEEEALNKIKELGYITESLEKIDISDRRVFLRVNMEMTVWFNRVKSGHESDFDGQGLTVNISAGGILFKTNKSYSVGTTIDLMVELPEGEEDIQCLGRVIRCDSENEGESYDIAVSFLDLPHQERNCLSEFLNRANKET